MATEKIKARVAAKRVAVKKPLKTQSGKKATPAAKAKPSAKSQKYNLALRAMEQHAVSGQELIEGLMILEGQDYMKMSLTDLGRLFNRIKSLHEALDYTKKKVGVLIGDIGVTHLPTKMDEEDQTKFTIEGLGTVHLLDDLRIKILDKGKLIEWLEEIGSGDLVDDAVNTSSLKALLRRRLKAGEEVPKAVDLKPFVRASISKR